MWRFNGALSAIAATCIIGAGLVGCDDEANLVTSGGGGQTGAGGDGAGGEPSFVEGGLEDAEIAHVLGTANDVEIEQAMAVHRRLQHPLVVDFADRMSTEHTAANEALDQVVIGMGVEPMENDFSFDLEANGDQTVMLLSMTENDIIDAVFMETQVATHEYALQLMDMHLMPVVNDTELADYLIEQRAKVERDLLEAESIRQQIGPVAGG